MSTGSRDWSSRMSDDYFLDMWRHDDPWGFEDRWYERRKRDLTMAALPDRRYVHVFEPGCAQGMLTRRLATRADRVTALELVPHVAVRARQRCRDLAHVDVRTGAVPDVGPDLGVDLVVASEVLYYLEPSGLDRFVDQVALALAPGGAVVAVHWRGDTNHPQSGDAVHERLGIVPWLRSRTHLVEDDFRLDAWVRA